MANDNNFKKLENYYIEQRDPNAKDDTKQNIESNKQLFDFVSAMIDLFVPKVGSVITDLSNPKDKKNNSSN